MIWLIRAVFRSPASSAIVFPRARSGQGVVKKDGRRGSRGAYVVRRGASRNLGVDN